MSRVEQTMNYCARLRIPSIFPPLRAPYTGPNACFVAYFASAELGCFRALGWPLPTNTLDLFAEHRVLTNGTLLPNGNGLLGAARRYGIDTIGADEKETMRDLIMAGGPWSATERAAILDYCAIDVDLLRPLLDLGTFRP